MTGRPCAPPWASRAAYLTPAPGSARDPFDYVPEMSRRARGFAVYAALRSLGRQGLAELVERCCAIAARMAATLAAAPGVTILNEVVPGPGPRALLG